jgi:hypothetical protein
MGLLIVIMYSCYYWLHPPRAHRLQEDVAGGRRRLSREIGKTRSFVAALDLCLAILGVISAGERRFGILFGSHGTCESTRLIKSSNREFASRERSPFIAVHCR